MKIHVSIEYHGFKSIDIIIYLNLSLNSVLKMLEQIQMNTEQDSYAPKITYYSSMSSYNWWITLAIHLLLW